jgi:hypothetical protein
MAQLSTDTLAHAQVIVKVQQFIAEYVQNKNVSPKDYDKAYQNLISDIRKFIGGPTAVLDFINKGDIPSSEKFNKFVSSISNDVNLITHQFDSLSANYINTFNIIHDEIESEKSSVDRIRSKIAALELYSGSTSNNITYFGDLLNNMDLIDVSKSTQIALSDVSDGIATLPKKDVKPWKSRVSVYNPNYAEKNTQLNSNPFGVSSGLPGCNFLYSGSINDQFLFQKDINLSKSDPSKIIDNSPASYMEYEAIYVDKKQNGIDRPQYEFEYSSGNTFIDWSSFDPSKPLKLTVELTSTRSGGEYVNHISITPFFGYDDVALKAQIKNVKVTSIKLFNDKNESGVYEILNEGPVYIGADISGANLSNYKNYSYNKGVFRFPEVLVNKIYITFEQSFFQDVNIKHAYWTPYSSSDFLNTNNSNKWQNQDRFDPTAPRALPEGTEDIKWSRKSVVPDLQSPTSIKGATSDVVKVDLSYVSNAANKRTNSQSIWLKRNFERLTAKRAAIGIRDITVSRETYVETAEIISKPYHLHDDLDLLSLEVSDYTPNNEESATSIDYYVSVDDGFGWIKISPIQRNFVGVPEILSFNQNLNSNNILPQIAYYSYPEVPNPIKTVRFRAILKKTKSGNLTPVLGSYKIAIRFR